MSLSNPSNLPPGVTDEDVERAAGAYEEALDVELAQRRALGLWLARDSLTLRDHFAGQALAGLVSLAETINADDPDDGLITMDEVAEGAYRYADAMLKERAE